MSHLRNGIDYSEPWSISSATHHSHRTSHSRYSRRENSSSNPVGGCFGVGRYRCIHARSVWSDQRCCHGCCSLVSHITGDADTMTNDASHMQDLADPAFLSHFAQNHPQPHPWKPVAPFTWMTSTSNSALRCSSPEQPKPELLV